jgi:hypothetical protein
VGVHQDVRDRWILEQGLQRAQSQDLVEQLLDQETELLGIERRTLVREQLVDDRGDLAPKVRLGHLFDCGQVQLLKKPLVESRLEVEPAGQLFIALGLLPVMSNEFRSGRRAIGGTSAVLVVVGEAPKHRISPSHAA